MRHHDTALGDPDVSKFRSVARATLALVVFLAGCAAPVPRAEACTDRLASETANSCIVTKGLLWRGAKPDAAGATALLTLGVRTVVNLELLYDDRDSFRDSRPSVTGPRTVSYFRIREWEPNVVLNPALLDDHVAEFIAIAKTQEKPVYVHCRSGQNRTGIMVAAFRVIEENMTVDAAIAEMEGYQGIWFKQDAEYVRQLQGDRRQRVVALISEKMRFVQPEARLQCTSDGCTTQ